MLLAPRKNGLASLFNPSEKKKRSEPPTKAFVLWGILKVTIENVKHDWSFQASMKFLARFLFWEAPGQLQGLKTPSPETPRKKLKNYLWGPDPKLL